MAIYDRICRTCGVSFKGGPRAWYCPDCRKERQRERSAKYRKSTPKRSLGSKDICQNCGEEYTVEGGLQKYCPKCQDIMHKKLDTEQSLEYYRKNKEIINPARNAKRRVPDARCVICGKDFKRSGRAKACPECRKEYKNGNWRSIYGKRYTKK